MKVITIKEPWATLIAEGLKEYEFRTWKTKYRGKLLIHAGKGIDKEAMDRFKYLNLKYHSGQIIAQVDITDCVKVNDELRKKLKEINPIVYKGVLKSKDFDGYGFKLENIKKINPIYINGKLGLWDYNESD
ncbi:MAG: ASCH domain-containing protein [Clostridium sp.]|nr:ASCH domain-containing protein [Clostridium sp.]MCM1444310.1 ASCH domain-containing protein [Candidatus Amulumruptor caecigallinarius]